MFRALTATTLSRALLGAVIAVAAGSGSAARQQGQPAFRADVEQVLLHVAVINPGGGPIPPLTREDFTVFDDGIRQDIKLFVAPADAPLDIGLVLDSSGSMAPVETQARRAATTFLRRLAPDDCVYVLPFSSTVRPGRWGRSGDPQLHGFVASIDTGGGTSLYDALLEGLAVLERAEANTLVAVANEAEEEPGGADEPRPAAPASTGGAPPPAGEPPIELPPRRIDLRQEVRGAIRDLELYTPPPVRGCGEPLPPGFEADPTSARRRALVVVSDGADIDSNATRYDALGAARAASMPIFPVAMGYANDDPQLKAELAELARATGGRMVESTAPGRLVESYDQIVTLLRSYYLIGYDPGFEGGAGEGTAPARPRWHDVRVELRRPNFEPLVRPGYYR